MELKCQQVADMYQYIISRHTVHFKMVISTLMGNGTAAEENTRTDYRTGLRCVKSRNKITAETNFSAFSTTTAT